MSTQSYGITRENVKRAVLIGLVYSAIILFATAVFGTVQVTYSEPIPLEFHQLSSEEQQAWREANEIRLTGLTAAARILRDPWEIFRTVMQFLLIASIIVSACMIMVRGCRDQTCF